LVVGEEKFIARYRGGCIEKGSRGNGNKYRDYSGLIVTRAWRDTGRYFLRHS